MFFSTGIVSRERLKTIQPPINTDEPPMAGRPATLEDENTFSSLIEESITCKVFSEQHG
jgi:hypothetical protein